MDGREKSIPPPHMHSLRGEGSGGGGIIEDFKLW